MEVRLLGPVEVHAAGRVWDAGPRQQRHVLAALAADAGRPLTTETLIDRVWDEAPSGARRALHVHLTRIRRLLEQAGGGSLTRRAGGYQLEAGVDLLAFRRLAGEARSPALLGQARALWRGEPLAGLGGAWVDQCRRTWRREYLEATEAWARAHLAAGDPEAVIGALTELTADEPFVESAAALLMRALHAAGRSTEAARFYQSLRQSMVDELGVDPGPALQELHQAILRQDVPAESGARAPAQLPMDVRGFTGRTDELTRLDAVLNAADQHPTAVIISAVSGTAGVGKTALAVHWAHRSAARFPDGQLYVNLRGFGPDGTAVSPADAVRNFLHALQVSPQQLPAELDAQTALYRSLLAGRRMLVVLDNARDAAQVRALLPGTAGCLVLVTSRNQLAGLVAAEGAHPVQLDLLSPAEARGLLAERLGAHRTAAEPQAVDDIVTACARLPLAIVVAAARAATRPALPLAALAEELRQARGVLDALAGPEPATDARAIFSWSYQALDPGTAGLFRLLGRHPGPDVTAPAAASLTGLPRAQDLLTRLAQAHLITEHTPGRYSLHDLLRAYAAELSDPQAVPATARLLDHYLHTAHGAALLLYPRRHPITLAPIRPGVTPERFTGHREATAWFTAEHPVLFALIELAAESGFEAHAWQLAWTLWDFLDRSGQWPDLVSIQLTALAAADRVADRAGQAHSHHGLGFAHEVLDEHDKAEHHLRTAVDLFGALGDHAGQANTYLSVCICAYNRGNRIAAVDASERALELYQAAGNGFGQAAAHNNLAVVKTELGDHEPALEHCRRAVVLYEQEGDRHGRATGWDSLGLVHRHLGHYEDSIAAYEQARAIFRDLGDRHLEADTLANLGDVHQHFAHRTAAHAAWRQALRIFDELNHPGSARVREKLAGG